MTPFWQRGSIFAGAPAQSAPGRVPAAGSVPSPVRHWLDSDTYADEDGVVHTVDGSGQDVGFSDDSFDVSAFDLSLLGRIEDIFGKIFILR